MNLFQPNIRPIVREKDKAKTEFGAKIKIGEVNGVCRIDRFSQDAYNESTGMKKQVENFKHTYGFYPRVLLGDQIFLTRKNSWILPPLSSRKSDKLYYIPATMQNSHNTDMAFQDAVVYGMASFDKTS